MRRGLEPLRAGLADCLIPGLCQLWRLTGSTSLHEVVTRSGGCEDSQDQGRVAGGVCFQVKNWQRRPVSEAERARLTCQKASRALPAVLAADRKRRAML